MDSSGILVVLSWIARVLLSSNPLVLLSRYLSSNAITLLSSKELDNGTSKVSSNNSSISGISYEIIPDKEVVLIRRFGKVISKISFSEISRGLVKPDLENIKGTKGVSSSYPDYVRGDSNSDSEESSKIPVKSKKEKREEILISQDEIKNLITLSQEEKSDSSTFIEVIKPVEGTSSKITYYGYYKGKYFVSCMRFSKQPIMVFDKKSFKLLHVLA